MSEEMKQSFPNPTCPYCGMNMKSGDGSWWCMDKTCHEQLNPYGIAQTSDWKEGPAQPPKAKPAPWMKKVVSAWFGSAHNYDNREKELLALLITYAPQTAPSSSASEYESASEWYVRMGFTAIAFGLDEAFILAERYAAERQRRG
jgi:hypothetical protein